MARPRKAHRLHSQFGSDRTRGIRSRKASCRTNSAHCSSRRRCSITVEEGGSGGKHFELVENADIMIETTHRSDAQRIYHRGFGQDEVAFQLSGRRATLTDQGEYMLETGDFLLIPPGTSHRNIGDMATIRIILYTRNPLALGRRICRSRKTRRDSRSATVGEVNETFSPLCYFSDAKLGLAFFSCS